MGITVKKVLFAQVNLGYDEIKEICGQLSDLGADSYFEESAALARLFRALEGVLDDEE